MISVEKCDLKEVGELFCEDEDQLLILKTVKIDFGDDNRDSSSNSCDNCKPWTSCCDSFR